MTMRTASWWLVGLSAVFLAACQAAPPDSGGDAGEATDSESDGLTDPGPDSESDGLTDPETDSDSDAPTDTDTETETETETETQSDTGSGTCGGFVGAVCETDEWCDFEPSTCGGADDMGVCRERPSACDDIYQPVCGCNNVVYSNPCDAAASGQDLNLWGSCTPPAGMFACGAWFCDLSYNYCRRTVSDVVGYPDDYQCVALPGGCGATPSCGCLSGEVCSEMCSGSAASGLTLTCPGG